MFEITLCKSSNSTTVVPPPSKKDDSFHDKFTVCVVDYSSIPVANHNGMTMRYLLYEGTKYTVLHPLADNNSNIIHHELKLIFSLLGHPKQLSTTQPELATSFPGVIMNVINPWESADQGDEQPRQVNQIILSVNKVMFDLDVSAQAKQAGRNSSGFPPSNWVSLIPEAMVEINLIPYSEIFGMDLTTSCANVTTFGYPLSAQPQDNETQDATIFQSTDNLTSKDDDCQMDLEMEHELATAIDENTHDAS